MYTEIERIDLIRQLSQLCEALLMVQMDEQDRQNIFDDKQVSDGNLELFVDDGTDEKSIIKHVLLLPNYG